MKRIFWMWILFCLQWGCSSSVASITSERILPAEHAFQFAAEINTHHEIIATWRMPPGFFLYKDKISFLLKPRSATYQMDMVWPSAKRKWDKNRGWIEVYEKELRLVFPLKSSQQPVHMSISYQGCSEWGFCYAPITKERDFFAKTPSFYNQAKTFLSKDLAVQEFLERQSTWLIVPMFFFLGILLSLTPCVLPMVPILASILLGQKAQGGTRHTILVSCSYVLGMSLVYALAGFFAAYLGASLQGYVQHFWMQLGSAAVFVWLALVLFGWVEFRMPRFWMNTIAHWTNRQNTGTLFGACLMGMLSTLIVSPCVTAPLAGVLLYIAEHGNRALGAGVLFVMGLGMGIPLLIVGWFSDQYLPKRGAWMVAVQRFLGICMLAVACLLLYRVMPSHFLQPSAAVTSTRTVSSMKQLQVELYQARVLQKPVVLDYYADWCTSCHVLESTVFADKEVKRALQAVVLIRVDITKNDLDALQLMHHYRVAAPPSLIYLDAVGRELTELRQVGEIDVQGFLQQLSLLVK